MPILSASPLASLALTAERGQGSPVKLNEDLRDGKIYSGQHCYRELNEALMDLGRVICQAKKVDCVICPMATQCVTKNLQPLNFPLPAKKGDGPFELDLVRCVAKRGERILVYQKKEKEWLSGQYELPTFTLKSQDSSLKQYPPWSGGKINPVATLKSGITKYKIANHIIEISPSEARQLFKDCGELVYKRFSREQNLSSTTFKILNRIGVSL